MSLKRLSKKGKKNAILQEVDEVDSASSEEEEEEKPRRHAQQPKKKKGIKWIGIVFLVMFLLPVVTMCFLNIYDFLYPKVTVFLNVLICIDFFSGSSS